MTRSQPGTWPETCRQSRGICRFGYCRVSGLPSAIGRPAIDSSFARYFAATKIKVAEITLGSVNVTSAATATATGSYHAFEETAGKPVHQWWRWVAAYEKQPDGKWKTSYIMAFADSTK